MVIGMREDAGRRMASGHIAKNTGMAQRVSGHPKAHPYITGGELNEGSPPVIDSPSPLLSLTAANT